MLCIVMILSTLANETYPNVANVCNPLPYPVN